MERSDEGRRTLEQTLVHWRSVGLIGACLAGGLTLTVMVIGSTPRIGGPIAAATEVVAAQSAVDPSTTLVVDPAMVEVAPDPTEVPVTPAPELPAPSALIQTAPASPAPVAAPVAAPTAAVPVPAQPIAQPASNLFPQAAPATPVPTPAPTTPQPAPTAPPSTPPTPSTAPSTSPSTVPPPTTAAPAPTPQLTYPSYTVSGVSGVTLQFDGSSINVASLSPQANWVYEIATNGPRSVEIKFFNVATGSDREFHATVDGGRIKVET
jgi:hypothetical protein